MRCPPMRTLPRNALPDELAGQAAIPGMPVIRAYGGELSPYMMADLGDLFRIFADAQRSQSGFHWVTIPTEVSLESNEMFDPVTMRRLFDFGLAKGQSDDIWFGEPPVLSP